MYTVYAHITPNNKRYFGITSTDVKKRWYSDGSGYKSQRLFWRAIQKYGWNNIKHIIVVEAVSKEWACQLEKLLIARYNSNDPQYGYNVYSGGDTGPLGFKFPKEFGEQIRQRNLGRTLSEETRHKMSLSHKGKPHSKEHNKKVALANTGRKLSKEQRDKLSESHRGQVHSQESCKRQGQALSQHYNNLSEEEKAQWTSAMINASKRPVLLYQDDVLIQEFSSGKECADYLGVSPSFVCMIISGKRRYKDYKIIKTFK